jgi:succinoglycan biosynthesis protein ExoV
MKLFFCRIPDGNFGDDLNPYLWPRLLPNAFDGTVEYRPKDNHAISLTRPDEELFVGIGTLIHNRLPPTAIKHVFGSGYGYGSLPEDPNWHYHCVRGPLTTAKLGLAPDKAIVDPAVLIRLLPRPVREKRHRVSFIPHWEMAISGDWKAVCQLAGIHYIDPRRTPDEVIADIAATSTLITEALHGAIVADALRVPWMPVSSKHTILDFKWHDWCGSVGLTYAPTTVPTFWRPRPHVGALINGAKRLQAATTLAYLMKTGRPQLSRDGVLENRIERLLDVLGAFCKERGFQLNASPTNFSRGDTEARRKTADPQPSAQE